MTKIILELTIREAIILSRTLASSLPAKEDEVISMFLHARIIKKIEESSRSDE